MNIDKGVNKLEVYTNENEIQWGEITTEVAKIIQVTNAINLKLLTELADRKLGIKRNLEGKMDKTNRP